MNRRSADNSAMERFAEQSWMKLISRISMILLVPISMFVGGRLLAQLDANTEGLKVVSTSLAVTVRVLDNISQRVDGLEERERANLRTPNR